MIEAYKDNESHEGGLMFSVSQKDNDEYEENDESSDDYNNNESSFNLKSLNINQLRQRTQ